MIGLFCFALAVLASSFRSKLRLEAENAALRHQLIVLRRRLHGPVRLTNHDRWFFIQLYRWFPAILKVLTIIRPETLVRWHRAGFHCYWRWKSRPRGGRPQIERELRAWIRQMSVENPLWGAPRIHGELLKLGFQVAQSSVAKYMAKRRGPPSQGWCTFLRNHAPNIAAMDLFVVPTIGFKLLYAFVVVRLDRRELVWINVTAHPTAEWVARQITEAFPWNEAPRYMVRDHDRIYGTVVTRRLRAMGIRDKPIAPASPWQNGFAERLIGSIRRECADHIIVLGEAHLRQLTCSERATESPGVPQARSGGERRQFHSVTEIGQSFDQTLFLLVGGPPIEVIAAEVLVQRSILEHVIDGGEHRGRDREDRLLLATASRDAEELGLQIAVFLFDRCPGALHQRGLEPDGALAHPIGSTLAGTLIVPRTKQSP